MDRERVAVVGGGVAGIVAAFLLSRKFEVDLYEGSDYLGGHTNTIPLTSGPDSGIAIDTGFIVLNDMTYPHLHKFLAMLDVPVRYADMSFSFSCEKTGLEYCSRTVNTLFAQPWNLINPRFLKMLIDVLRFWKVGARDLANSTIDGQTLGEWLTRHRLTGAVSQDYLIPISGAIWSSSDVGMLDFPARTFLEFFKNHGLLGYLKQPRWQTVVGGSFRYVKRFQEQFPGSIKLSTPVKRISRNQQGVEVTTALGAQQYSYAVVALHADLVLPILDTPCPLESEVFSPWTYERNYTVLHSDTTFLPRSRRAWASWNYRRELGEDGTQPVSVTYHMNGLQGFEAQSEYCVTLNPRRKIPEEKILYEIEYSHPQYTVATLAAREILLTHEIGGRIHYCGSYHGFGFHEDAVVSAVRVAKRFGIDF